MKLYCRLEVIGVENIPQTGGVIVASNHIGGGDPPFIGASFRRESYFLAKRELFKNFFLRTLISNLNAIPVDRKILDQRALDAALKALANGKVLILFPEGTRSKTGQLGKGKPGIGLLARKALVPIVPAHIANSRGFLKIPLYGKNLIIKYGKQVETSFIESIPDDKDGYRLITEEVMRRIKSLEESENSELLSNISDRRPHEKPFA